MARFFKGMTSLQKGVKRPNEKSGNWRGGMSKKEGYQQKIQRLWREKNKEKLKMAVRTWKKENKDRVLHSNQLRRAMRRGNGGSHTFQQWETLKAQYNWTCPCCKKVEPEIKLTEDHIIPLSKGGSNNIENIQPLCRSCNCKKRTNIIKYD